MRSITFVITVYVMVSSSAVYALPVMCRDLFRTKKIGAVSKEIDLSSQNEKASPRWIELGQRVLENEKFQSNIDMALKDFQKFQSTENIPVHLTEVTLSDVIEGLKKSKDPMVVGRFVEVFSKTDRLTRQYLLSQIVSLEQVKGSRYYEVDIKLSPKSEEALAKIKPENLNRLEEQAYFDYTSYHKSYRPQITDLAAARTIALRYLESKNYQVLLGSTSFAAKVLARTPYADTQINQILVKLIHQTAVLPPYILLGKEPKLALIELSILERTARKLSSLETNLKFVTQVLSSERSSPELTVALVEFHKRNNLLHFPELFELVVQHYKKSPQQLEELERIPARVVDQASVTAFRRDLGL